jgi:hypothetical protein
MLLSELTYISVSTGTNHCLYLVEKTGYWVTKLNEPAPCVGARP